MLLNGGLPVAQMCAVTVSCNSCHKYGEWRWGKDKQPTISCWLNYKKMQQNNHRQSYALWCMVSLVLTCNLKRM